MGVKMADHLASRMVGKSVDSKAYSKVGYLVYKWVVEMAVN